MRSPKMDPLVQADLDALDAALAGEREDLAVAIIADEARTAAEPMPPGLALRLESAIADGFARPAKRRRGWALGPAVGVLGAGAVALVIALGTTGGEQGDLVTSSGGSEEAGRQLAKPQTDAAGAGELSGGTSLPPVAADESSSQIAPGPVDTDAAPNGRRVQRAADLTLTTPIGDLQTTSDEVIATTDRLGGYVQQSDVSAGDESGRASFDLRIPADKLDEALAALSELGHVRSRTQQSEDITARFTSARSRLNDARVERQALLRALAAATTEAEIDSLEQRLEIARSRIAAAKGDLFSARRAASMARVSVAVVGTGEDEGGAAGGGDRWTPGKALEDAVEVLSVAAGVLIVGIAGAIPAGLVALLLLAAWRAQRRRSRELTLDAPGGAV
jgi:hypothetical protein